MRNCLCSTGSRFVSLAQGNVGGKEEISAGDVKSLIGMYHSGDISIGVDKFRRSSLDIANYCAGDDKL